MLGGWNQSTLMLGGWNQSNSFEFSLNFYLTWMCWKKKQFENLLNGVNLSPYLFTA